MLESLKSEATTPEMQEIDKQRKYQIHHDKTPSSAYTKETSIFYLYKGKKHKLSNHQNVPTVLKDL